MAQRIRPPARGGASADGGPSPTARTAATVDASARPPRRPWRCFPPPATPPSTSPPSLPVYFPFHPPHSGGSRGRGGGGAGGTRYPRDYRRAVLFFLRPVALSLAAASVAPPTAAKAAAVSRQSSRWAAGLHNPARAPTSTPCSGGTARRVGAGGCTAGRRRRAAQRPAPRGRAPRSGPFPSHKRARRPPPPRRARLPPHAPPDHPPPEGRARLARRRCRYRLCLHAGGGAARPRRWATREATSPPTTASMTCLETTPLPTGTVAPVALE